MSKSIPQKSLIEKKSLSMLDAAEKSSSKFN